MGFPTQTVLGIWLLLLCKQSNAKRVYLTTCCSIWLGLLFWQSRPKRIYLTSCFRSGPYGRARKATPTMYGWMYSYQICALNLGCKQGPEYGQDSEHQTVSTNCPWTVFARKTVAYSGRYVKRDTQARWRALQRPTSRLVFVFALFDSHTKQPL